MTAQKKILLIALAAVAFAGLFVVIEPGSLEKDAGEYHLLAESILQGQYALEGQPSMLREPGYPLFRAVLLAMQLPASAVLWVQALLYGVIIWLIGDAVRRVEPKAAPWAALAAVFAYGLAIYAAKHTLEMVATTIASLALWMAVRALTTERRMWPWVAATGAILGALLLTRTTFLFLVPILAGVIGWHAWRRVGLRRGFLAGASVIAVAIAVALPWSLRNHATFGEWNIAGKAGGQVYVRAWKAELPTNQLVATIGSVVFGESLLSKLVPTADPIVFEQWDVFNARERAAFAGGQPVHEFQREIQQEGIQMLLHPRTFVMAALWTIPEELRLFALPSPFSREFSIEAMFFSRLQETGALSAAQTITLLAAHAFQFTWWTLAAISLWWGLRRYGVRFMPIWMFFCIALAYAPADTIVRYAAPAHPWMLAAIAWMLSMTRPWERWRKGKILPSASPSLGEGGR